jgi:SAM-dependent methyltransferase
LRLAEGGTFVIGLDRSPDMLAFAQQKSVNIDRISWVEGDMRSFAFDKIFDLVLIPSHSFQNLNTPDDQTACIECIWQHLKPGGLLVVHLDHMNIENMRWLGEISGEEPEVFKQAEQFTHPKTGLPVQTSRAWSYQPGSQTAIVQTIWEEIGPDSKQKKQWNSGPTHLHVVFRFEMEHLLRRVGFEVEYVYGDFDRQELSDDSPNMIWLARK